MTWGLGEWYAQAANFASDEITVESSRAKNNVIRRAAYRKRSVIFLCNVCYTYVKEELIRKLALRTGTLAAWDGSQDTGVHVYAGQYQVPFGPVCEKVLANEKGSAGNPESLDLARAVDEPAYQKAVQRIKEAAEGRRAAKREKGEKKKKKKQPPAARLNRKRKSSHSKVASTEQRPKKRGRPRKGASGAEVEEVVQASASSTSGDEFEDLSSEQDSDAYEHEEQWKEFLTDKQVARYQKDQKVDLDKTFMKGELVVITGHPECGDPTPLPRRCSCRREVWCIRSPRSIYCALL